MLFIENLQKRFAGKLLFDQSTLTLNKGEKVGIIGPNGSGKTTFLRILAGMEESDAGRIRMAGGLRVGILAQELTPSHRSLLEETLEGDRELMELRRARETIQLQLAEGLKDTIPLTLTLGDLDHRLETLGAFHAESRAGTILHGLGFSADQQSMPLNTFSGGWRMRVALAQLLFSRADLMLMDEPTNHLDLESSSWLERYIQGVSSTCLIISHDRGFLARTTQVTVAIEGHELVRYGGGFERYLVLRQEKLERLEKSAAKQAIEAEHLETFIRRFRAKATKAKQVQSRVKRLEKLETVRISQPSAQLRRVRLPDPKPSAREVLELENVAKSFDSNTIFSGVNLLLERGTKIGLIGPNGAGKSTLLKLINGVLSPDVGQVKLGDRVVCGHFAQHAMEALLAQETILASALRAAPLGTSEGTIRTVLGGFLFSGEEVFKTISVLSGGEKARVALARLFLSGPNLLLLDEPTNHLDMESRAALEEGLSDYAGSVILVSHDRDLLEAVCDQFWLISHGTIRPWEEDLDAYLEYAARRDIQEGENQSSAKTGPKERRREAAQKRQALELATRSLKKELSTLETNIHSMETDLQSLQNQLADPEMHAEKNKEKLKFNLTEHGRIETRLAAAMARWEEISLAMEAKENEVTQSMV